MTASIHEDRSRVDDSQKPVALRVDNLSVAYRSQGSWSRAVDGVSFDVRSGEVFGIVGESGSGKSTVIRAIARLLPTDGARVESGRVTLGQTDVLSLSTSDMQAVRGARIGYVFQDPLSALNPVYSVGYQIGETIRQHGKFNQREVDERTVVTMERVGIPEPHRRARAYPHELSGGLRQRVALAIALAASPSLLLADEPTTALDVTIQDQLLQLLLDLRDELGMSIVLVTHDLGVVAQVCQRVAVMYRGRFLETGSAAALLRESRHPYTEGLLNSIPALGSHVERLVPIPGAPPELGDRMVGCPFAPRCAHVTDACRSTDPLLEACGSEGHRTACLRHFEIWPEASDV